ncbi:MAG: hypothetical protein R2799_09715 [Crocinitomicaceae bacterium]
MQDILKDHPYIKELLKIEAESVDRHEFHKNSHSLMAKMGQDKEFLKLVLKRNFIDKGYQQHEWSEFNIPFFYIYETDHFVLKLHIFPRNKEKIDGLAAHAIHHHNNYILSSYAFFGSGYESMLFDKRPGVDNELISKMGITNHFHQKDWNPSVVDSWEPHIVFVPDSLSATLVLWTPDEKRKTDKLRQNPILKPIKKPLRAIIHKLGMTNKLGIAENKTYQWYPDPKGRGFQAILEEEYFAPSKAAKGPKVDEYSMNMIGFFIQNAELVDKKMIEEVIKQPTMPEYMKKVLQRILNDEKIEEVFHIQEINVPQKFYLRDDIFKVASK